MIHLCFVCVCALCVWYVCKRVEKDLSDTPETLSYYL